METTVTAIFGSQDLARHATEQLLAAGYRAGQLSLVLADSPNWRQAVHHDTEDRPRGAMTGAAVGGVFAAILAGALPVPVFGVFAAGPLLAMLAAAPVGAVAGATAGTLIGAAVGTQVESEYDHRLEAGDVLLAVHTDHAHARAARAALAAAGGSGISDAVHGTHRAAEA